MSTDEVRIVSASREMRTAAGQIFEAIADPARQPEWDGNDNLAVLESGERIRAVDEVFAMRLKNGAVRENHVVEFDEGRLIARKPAEPGQPPVGHLWRWAIEPIFADRSVVTHTYDWTDLHDENRFPRARDTGPERLLASLDRLAALPET